MTWGKPHKEKKSKAQSQMGESEIKAKLDALKATIQRAFDSRSRFWFYTLLACAYALYDEWRAVRHSKKNAKKAARSFGLKIKDGAHPLTAIIKVLTQPASTPVVGRTGCASHARKVSRPRT